MAQVAYSNTWWTSGFSVECKPTHWLPIPDAQNDAAAPDFSGEAVDRVWLAERLRILKNRRGSIGGTPELAEFYRDGCVELVRELQELIDADAHPPAADEAMGRDGVGLIAAERKRQVEAEGWTPEHDDDHSDGSLAVAAACYATQANQGLYENGMKARDAMLTYWPWDWGWWKPTPDNRIRELVKAGALIAAEIDRLQRAAMRGTAQKAGEEG